MSTFNARRKDFEVITTREYLKRHQKDPKSVSGAKVVTAKLGSNSFGGFAIKRVYPEYEILNEQ